MNFIKKVEQEKGGERERDQPSSMELLCVELQQNTEHFREPFSGIHYSKNVQDSRQNRILCTEQAYLISHSKPHFLACGNPFPPPHNCLLPLFCNYPSLCLLSISARKHAESGNQMQEAEPAKRRLPIMGCHP